jgi:hypothetical protein
LIPVSLRMGIQQGANEIRHQSRILKITCTFSYRSK